MILTSQETHLQESKDENTGVFNELGLNANFESLWSSAPIEIFDALPSLIAFTDKDLLVQFCNQAFSDWLEVERAQVVGRHTREVFGDIGYATLEPYLLRVISGESLDHETWVSRVRGNPRYIRIRLTPVYRDLELKGSIISITDLTEQKLATDRLQNFWDLPGHLLAVADLTSGLLVELSPAWQQVLGYPLEILKSRPWLDFVHPEDREKTLDAGKRLALGERIVGFENRYRCSDGLYKWMQWTVHPIESVLYCVVKDISEEKKIDFNLRQAAERLEMAIDGSGLGLWEWVADGDQLYYSERCLAILGTNKGALENGLHGVIQRLVHPDDRERVKTALRIAIESRTPYSFEYRIIRESDGRTIWILAKGKAHFTTTGSLVRMIGTVADINESKVIQQQLMQAKEEAERANSYKTTFLANMSHEIRTPMTAVLGFTEVLRDSTISPEQRQDALSRIECSGRSLLRLIDDILDISKIEAGKLVTEKVRFSPVEIVSEVVALLRLQAEQKGLRLVAQFLPGTPIIAHSDPTRIRQILVNLIGNAIKFTRTGEVNVKVRAEPEGNEKKQFLTFEVIDTGIGISPDDQLKLFQPFAQADESITRTFGGTGLGLVLSRRLAQQLGGDLILTESHVGSGSRFLVKIEAGPMETAVVAEQASCIKENGDEANEQLPPSLISTNILVVDDVPDNQYLMRLYLETAGAHVDVASNGVEAISKALNREYDLILMDIQMPTLDGIEATHRLRSAGYQRPILALTAHAMREEKKRSLDAGCDAHLTKPITRKNLIERVYQVLHKK